MAYCQRGGLHGERKINNGQPWQEANTLNNRLKIILTGFVIICLASVGYSIYSAYDRSHHGNVILNFQFGGSGAAISFNGNYIKPKANDSYVYNLRSGNVLLAVTEPGFANFSTSFELNPGQTININVNLKPSSKPSATDLSKIVLSTSSVSASTLASQYSPSATATANYFDNNTWAYVTVDTMGGPGVAYFILQYNETLGRWVIVSGPLDDSGNVGGLNALPQDMQQYLKSKGDYSGNGG